MTQFSKSFQKLNRLRIVIALFLTLTIIGLIFLWLQIKIELLKEEQARKEQLLIASGPLIKGEIGEPELEEAPVTNLPSLVFNTTGFVQGILSDRLIALGSGSNFSDQQTRTLILIFTEDTVTFEPGQKIKYRGFEGLNHFETGDKISISSSENIRGKAEFTVNTINKF
jgi:hypothetical protein